MAVGPAGFVNVLKPPGMSSGDVVGVVRRRFNTRQVGHLGTLDPLAAGVLPLAVGWATRLIPYLPPADIEKAYVAEACLGIETDSQDAAGQVVRRAPVPPLSEADLVAALSAFVGPGQQVPPMASAVHHQGQRLYQLHRAGIEVEREARPITIHDMRLLAWDSPRLVLSVACSAGTYVRTLCHDLGRRLGCGAHMAFLVRTRSGAFHLEESVALEDLGPDALTDAGFALSSWPARALGADDLQRVRYGQRVPAAIPPGLVRLLDGTGQLVAVGQSDGQSIHANCVLPPCFT